MNQESEITSVNQNKKTILLCFPYYTDWRGLDIGGYKDGEVLYVFKEHRTGSNIQIW